MKVLCSKQHPNIAGNRFCTQCGEALAIPPGEMVANRYRVVRILGQGGFGRTYLVEDTHQEQKACVMKEFAPQVENPEDVLKAKELFEREADVLKKLQHAQIPKFHRTLQTQFGTKDFFFLVQDFVDGETYWDLLNQRLVEGKSFTEEEVILLLRQVLPVLTYLHSRDVIHRDISPDNLMRRRDNLLPMLIDFGAVKQLPASQGFWATQLGVNRTLLGKKGYAPEEQIRQGKVFPCSDIYSLGVTALVLLTGKEPQDLYDSYEGAWRWGSAIQVSPELSRILKKMVALKPSDRLQTAKDVFLALEGLAAPVTVAPVSNMNHSNQSHPTHQVNPPNSRITKIATMVAAPAARLSKTALGTKFHQQTQAIAALIPFPAWLRPFAVSMVGTTVVVLVIAGSVAVVNGVIRGVSSISLPNVSLPSLPSLPDAGNGNSNGGNGNNNQSNQDNQNNQTIANLSNRRQQLEIPDGFFVRTVNDIFYTQNPEVRGRALTGNPEDAALRQEWLKHGNELLSKLQQAELSSAVRRRLGSYSGQDYQRWVSRANNGEFGNYTIRQLNIDTNSKFDRLFPGVRRGNGRLNPQTYAQIWYAIAADQVDRVAR